MEAHDKNVTPPWKHGYWFNKKAPAMVFQVKDEKFSLKNLVCFDNPEVKEMMNGTWKHGDFGTADKKFVELTGIHNYNFMSEMHAYKFPGMLHKHLKYELMNLGNNFIYQALSTRMEHKFISNHSHLELLM